MEPSNHPARKIKYLLKTYAMSVQELSEKLGITLESLREILDEREAPTGHFLQRISSLFGVRENFFAGTVRMAPSAAAGAAEDPLDFTPAGAHGARPAATSSQGLKPHGFPAPSSHARPSGRGSPRLRRRKKLDLAELAARYQSLLDLLLDKKVFTRDEYQVRLEIIRAKIIERRASAKTR